MSEAAILELVGGVILGCFGVALLWLGYLLISLWWNVRQLKKLKAEMALNRAEIKAIDDRIEYLQEQLIELDDTNPEHPCPRCQVMHKGPYQGCYLCRQGGG